MSTNTQSPAALIARLRERQISAQSELDGLAYRARKSLSEIAFAGTGYTESCVRRTELAFLVADIEAAIATLERGAAS